MKTETFSGLVPAVASPDSRALIYKDTAAAQSSQPIFMSYAEQRLNDSPLHKLRNKYGTNKTGNLDTSS